MAKKGVLLIDADDVAVDLDSGWVEALNQKHGTTATLEDVTDWDITKTFPTLTRAQVFAPLKDPELWTRLVPIAGSQEYLQRLYDEGFEIFIVTATDLSTCYAKTLRLLQLFLFLDEQHIIIAHNKQMIHGDVLVDNYEHNLIGGDYFKILFDRPHNRKFKEAAYGIQRAITWSEVYSYIHQHFDGAAVT